MGQEFQLLGSRDSHWLIHWLCWLQYCLAIPSPQDSDSNLVPNCLATPVLPVCRQCPPKVLFKCRQSCAINLLPVCDELLIPSYPQET